MSIDLSTVLRAFADAVRDEYAPLLDDRSWEEDQLKPHVKTFIEEAGAALSVGTVRTKFEAAVQGIGRPDLAVYLDGLPVGHIELKKPGTGANAPRYTGRNKTQWGKFENLPNILYTDGQEWALFQLGERVGDIARLTSDVADGSAAISDADARKTTDLLASFFSWAPQVPRTPRGLAHILAPVCQLLRDDVAEAIQDPDSPLAALATDWRSLFFADASDAQFADAYAQTLTYALLLAQLSGADDLSTDDAVEALKPGHSLLAETLRVLGDPRARRALGSTVDLLQRIISEVDQGFFARTRQILDDGPAHASDPWLYFYEDFLAEYDPKMRRDRGVYYTPWQVVQAQVRLTAHLLDTGFDQPYGVASQGVVTLDPACGTGTYVLAAVRHGIDLASQAGRSAADAATRAAAGVHAFEILVGPYAVAHLRLTQQIRGADGALPPDGAHVYLTDTLDDPEAEPRVQQASYATRALAEEHKRALLVKRDAPVLLCLGNPPYDREQAATGETITRRKGGWVRYGHQISQATATAAEQRSRPILQDFLEPLAASGDGVHAKNLYNDYVYFWRWALWKTVGPQSGSDGGIVSFITASSFLRGPGFKGMRHAMRHAFDEIWILDLGGDNLGARKSGNVFAIQTPVCVATGVRYRDGDARRTDDRPATVRYARLDDDEDTKLDQLARIETFDSVEGFDGVEWADCPDAWAAPFLPARSEQFLGFPAVTDLFPWQENGLQFKRKWPIASGTDLLERRWQSLAQSDDPGPLMKETGARTVVKGGSRFGEAGETLPPIVEASGSPVTPVPYAYRSFDRQWVLPDTRICDRHRPTLHKAHGDRQSYLVSFLTNVPGHGPLAVATDLLPDLDSFRGSFGGKHVIPLYRDPAGRHPNVAAAVLARLGESFGTAPEAEDVFAYAFALLAAPGYVETFWEALETPGPRLPLTADPDLFAQVAALGRDLLWLHTYGERFVPTGTRRGHTGLPTGSARVTRPTPREPAAYPDTWAYDPATQRLTIGDGDTAGLVTDVPPHVMAFTVSGFAPVKSWLDYRKKSGAGRTSSPLDDIRPHAWHFDDELLDLLWVLEAVIDRHPAADALLARVLDGPLVPAAQIPPPTAQERKGPDGLPAADATTPLFGNT